MKILILNWRDIKNPTSGGAELLTHEMAKRWARWGHEIIQISSGFKNGKNEENIDGVRIIRIGYWWSIHILSFFYYLKNLKASTDIVIDEVHWFPFFSALYAKKKTVLLVCEVANRLFFELLPYPLALLGRAIEKTYLRFYKNVSALAISQSTKNDLVKEGFLEKNITVLPMGITTPRNFELFPKEKTPTLIYVGRINKLKGINDAIDAFSIIKKQIPDCMLWIVGKGEKAFVSKIKNKINSLNITSSVILFGFVTEEKKFELMNKAHILVAPSVKEGFGLTIPEAGAVGTPAVAYDVEGFRDVVKNGKNGILVDCNPEAMAKKVKEILCNKRFYEKLQDKAVNFAKRLNWDQTAKVGLGVFERLTDSAK